MVFRIEPKMPAHAYTTYQIASPISTHYRNGTCDEAGCLAHRYGWTTTVDESTTLGQGQAHYIRKTSGRRYVESRDAGLTTFTFEAGQKCFTTHKVPLDRPELYVVRGGDHRGNPRGEFTEHRADTWVESFAEHQDRIARVVNG
jgi:hypothetical protein